MRACFQPGLGWRNCTLDGVATRIPDLRLAPALAFAGKTVVSAKAEELRCIADLLSAQLRAHIRKIDVARLLICDIDSDVAARFAPPFIIGDCPAAAGRQKPPAGSKPNFLHVLAKG